MATPHRIAHGIVYQAGDGLLQRGPRKHSVCRLWGRDRKDASDSGQKTHIQHAVGFVEHQDF